MEPCQFIQIKHFFLARDSKNVLCKSLNYGQGLHYAQMKKKRMTFLKDLYNHLNIQQKTKEWCWQASRGKKASRSNSKRNLRKCESINFDMSQGFTVCFKVGVGFRSFWNIKIEIQPHWYCGRLTIDLCGSMAASNLPVLMKPELHYLWIQHSYH